VLFRSTNSKTKYTEDDIVNMINFFIDNIFIEFGGRIFQQTVFILMGTNCAPLLADLFLHSYEAEFVQGLLRKGEKKLAQFFNDTFRYIDNVLSLNNKNFSNFLHLVSESGFTSKQRKKVIYGREKHRKRRS